MSNRATLSLAAVAIALFAFIVVVERDTLSTSEVEGREARILPRFSRSRVNRVVVEPREGAKIVLERRASGEGEEDEREAQDEWWMVEPVETLADVGAVQTLLGLLEYSDARRRIPGLSDEDSARFGLDVPRVRLLLEVATERVELVVGDEETTGGGHYASLVGGSEAMVIGLDVVEGLEREANAYRSRALFPEGLVGLDALSIEDADGVRRAEREGGRWWLEGEPRIYASAARLDDLRRKLANLEVARFEPDEPEPMDPFAEPFLELTMRLGGARSEPVEHRLEIGAACSEGEGERFARLDDGESFCVQAAGLDALMLGPDELRDLRPFTTEEVDIEGVELESSGRSIVVTDEGGAWSFSENGAGGTSSGAADADALSEWLASARRARGLGFRPATEAALRAANLSAAGTTLTIRGRGDAPDEVIRIGRVDGERLLIRRDEEPVILELPAHAEETLRLSSLKLRSRALVHENEEALVRLEIERGDEGVERVIREGGHFRVEVPAAAPADRVVVRDVASRLASLSAIRFVAESATGAHGLDAPRFVLGFGFQGERPDAPEGEGDEERRERRLEIGAETEGGAFARLDDDPAVFVLPVALIELIRSPLMSRDLLSTQSLHLDRLTIESEAGTLTLRDEGAGLVDVDGRLDEATIAQRIQPLATLRASSVLGYGERPSERPRARVEVERDAAAGPPGSYVLLIGEGDGAGGVKVWREDLPATFVVSESALERLLSGSD